MAPYRSLLLWATVAVLAACGGEASRGGSVPDSGGGGEASPGGSVPDRSDGAPGVDGAAPGGPSIPNADDTVTVRNATGSAQANQPVSIGRPFVQGEIGDFAQASIGGAPLTTQCDVQNRWPDGSVKFAVVSFVVPSIPANGSVVVSFANQTSGNSTGFLSQTDMLSSPYNFDGHIQLSGTVSHDISARSVLSAAGSCGDPGTDPDGGKYVCSYWLKGPVVTAVILEDRSGRTFDVNMDNGTGSPLHLKIQRSAIPSPLEAQTPAGASRTGSGRRMSSRTGIISIHPTIQYRRRGVRSPQTLGRISIRRM